MKDLSLQLEVFFAQTFVSNQLKDKIVNYKM